MGEAAGVAVAELACVTDQGRGGKPARQGRKAKPARPKRCRHVCDGRGAVTMRGKNFSMPRAKNARGKVRGALPRTPARGTPPETPAPFPLRAMFQNGPRRPGCATENLFKSGKDFPPPRTPRAPWTAAGRSEEFPMTRERGQMQRQNVSVRRIFELPTKFHSHQEPQFDVGEPRQPAPHDHIPRWRIARTGEIATQSGNLDEIGGKRRLTTFGLFWKESIQQLSLYFGQRQQR